MFLFAVALNPITGICFINGLCPCSRLTGDAGFANERIEIHVVTLITWVMLASHWKLGKPLFLFYSCCFVLIQKMSLVLWDWVGFSPLLEFPFNFWEGTNLFHGMGCS